MVRALKSYRRIVVKIGSALLVDRAQGLKKTWLESLGADIAALQAQGVEVLVVSSGAVVVEVLHDLLRLFKTGVKIDIIRHIRRRRSALVLCHIRYL